MRQCYWICFRLFKYFLPDRKAGQVSPLAPQATLRCLIQFPLCFVFVHNSQSVGKYLSTYSTLGIWLGKGGSTVPNHSCNPGNTVVGKYRLTQDPVQAPVCSHWGVRKASQKWHVGQHFTDELKLARQRGEAVTLERKVSGPGNSRCKRKR